MCKHTNLQVKSAIFYAKKVNRLAPDLTSHHRQRWQPHGVLRLFVHDFLNAEDTDLTAPIIIGNTNFSMPHHCLPPAQTWRAAALRLAHPILTLQGRHFRQPHGVFHCVFRMLAAPFSPPIVNDNTTIMRDVDC